MQAPGANHGCTFSLISDLDDISILSESYSLVQRVKENDVYESMVVIRFHADPPFIVFQYGKQTLSTLSCVP